MPTEHLGLKIPPPWFDQIESVLQFVPESERPNTSEIRKELQETMDEAMLTTGEFKGYRIPAPFSWRNAEWVHHNWMPDKGDVLVASFPKTGTTWMRAIVVNLLHKDNEVGLKILTKDSPWLTFLEGKLRKQWIFNRPGEWYPHHILSWYPHRNDENVRFVYFEDLKKDPFTNIKKVAQFLEIDRSDEEIAEVVEATSFRKMSQAGNDGRISALTRKGIVGDWKNQFTTAQSEILEEKFEEVMKDADITFSYEPTS